MTRATQINPNSTTYLNAKLGSDVVIWCTQCYSPFDVVRKKGTPPMYCDDCRLERHRASSILSRTTQKGKGLSRAKRDALYKRGLSPDEFWRVFVIQNEVCATCLAHRPSGKYGQWQIDIDENNKIRGIFCNMCIKVVNNSQRDIELLQAHIDYIRNTK
jgi:hypothetical protein